MAFHPEFSDPSSPNRGYIYLQYPLTIDPIDGQEAPDNAPTLMRLARFTVDLESLQIDPASELVLIDQYDEAFDHQGGSMFFHPDDGFLYYAVGDEGRRDCILRNCQMIDKDLFSGVLRIDVDVPSRIDLRDSSRDASGGSGGELGRSGIMERRAPDAIEGTRRGAGRRAKAAPSEDRMAEAVGEPRRWAVQHRSIGANEVG
jgi:hypothetical protein